MTDKPENEREKRFRELDDSYRALYHLENVGMSEEEKKSLTPVLNTLERYKERYQILGGIAEGGEKKITLVYDHRLDRKVAMAHALREESDENQESFLREARLTANLAHPNIIPIHNMGLDEAGTPFFTMEHVATDSLKNILQQVKEGDAAYRKKYPLDNLLNIFLKICDAIAYAHSRQVLHLDIKPDNIRVGKFGEVYVIDWGLARVLPAKDPDQNHKTGELDSDVLNDITLSGIMKGSPGFMAPEQTVRDGQITEQTDVYALGSLLYMLLIHENPIPGNSANEVLSNTRKGRIMQPHHWRLDRPIPKGLAAVAMKALSFEPADRYSSVSEMQQEINRYQSGYTTVAENAGPITTLSLLMRRHSRITFLLISFLLLLAGLMSINMTVIRKAKKRAETEQQQAENNFELYRQEQEEVSLLNANLQKAFIPIISTPTFMTYERMIQFVDAVVPGDFPPNVYKDLLTKKGIAHFMLYQFNKANACFNQVEEDDIRPIRTICALSKKFAEIKPIDDIPLTYQQLADLLDDPKAKNVSPRSQRILCYTYLGHIRRFRDRNPEAHLSLVCAMLNTLNKAQLHEQTLKLTRRKEGFHLDLSHTEYKNYTLKIDASPTQNVLLPLKLNSLDISHTLHTDLSELVGLKLEELRMVGLKISAETLLFNLKYFDVKRLIIDAGAYPPAILNKIREQCEVIVE